MSDETKWDYVFNWQIVDYSFCDQKTGIELYSSAFTIATIDNTKWYLSIYPGGSQEEHKDYISCFVNRVQDDKYDRRFTVNFKFQFIVNRETLYLTDEIGWTTGLGRGIGHHQMIRRDNVLAKTANSTNILTIRCFIKKYDLITSLTDTRKCDAKTMISKDKCCFEWKVKFHYDVQNSKRFFYLDEKFYQVSLTIPHDYAVISVLNIKGNFIYSTRMIGVITFFDGKKGESIFKKDHHDFSSENKDENWELPSFISKQVLQDNTSKDGTITLCCEFLVLKGDESETLATSDNTIISELESLSQLRNDYLTLLREDDVSDVKLRVEDGIELSAHKCVLSARSPVFCAMFKRDMREKQTGIVDIVDVDVNTLKTFLEFLYTETVDNLDYGVASKLLLMADKYQIPTLKKRCSDFLISVVSVENVCKILSMADMVNQENLKSTSFDFAAHHATEIFSSAACAEWIGVNPKLSAEILSYLGRIFKETGKPLKK